MANDKKFIAKNGLLTPVRAIIGSTTDNGIDELQVTGTSNLAGAVTIENSTATTTSLEVENTGAGGFTPAASLVKLTGDADTLLIQNLVGGTYELTNTGSNNKIRFYNNTNGIAIQYAGSDRLVISSTGNDFKGLATSTIDGNRIITVLDQASQGGSFDAATLDQLDSTQFLRSDEDDTMFGSLIITGDLTVSGNTTYVDTETILLSDNIITLNSNFTSGTPSENAGWEVLRGSLATSSIQWDEGNDWFKLISAGVDLGRIITTADEGANNGFDADTVDGLDAWQFLRSDVDDTAQGNITIKGDLTVGDDVGAAQIILNGTGQDRVLYADNGEIGFLNAGFNWALKSDTNGDLEVERDVEAGRNVIGATGVTATTGNVTASAGDVIAQNNVTATTGDVSASAGSVTAQVNVTATTGNVSATAGDVTAGNNITAQNNITATTGNITASAGAISAATTVTAGTDVIGKRFVDADTNTYYADPASNSIFSGLGLDDNLFHNGDTDTRLRFETDHIKLETGGNTRFDVNNTRALSSLDLYAPNLIVNDALIHNNDTDTKITFATDTIDLDTGGATRLTANNSGVSVFGNLSVSGDINAGGDVYASIYYDADDNNYYADPNGTSVMKTIGIDDYIVHNGDSDTKIGFLQNDTLQMDAGGTTIFLAQSTAAEYYVDVYGEGAYFRKYYDNDNNAYFLDPGDTTLSLNVAGRARTGDGTLALPAYSFINDTNTGMYRKGADQIGFSAGGNEELVIYNNRVEAPGSVRSPIFYDLPDTTYYGDFAGTSQMSQIDIDSYIRHRGDTNTYMGFPGNDDFTITVDGTERLGIDTDSADFTVDVYAPKFIDSDNNSYYLDPADASLSAVLSSGVRIHTIGNYDRWSDTTGDGGISLVGAGDRAVGQSTTVAISGNYSGSYSLMYLNRIDPNANPFNDGNRYIEFRHDGTTGTNLSGDSSGNLYWLLLAGTSQSYWTQAGSELLTINDNGDIVVGGSSATYTDGGDNTPLTAAIDPAKLHVNGSIYLNGANNGIIFGRGTASFLRDEELGFGWGGGWYMTDATYLRVRNDKTILSGGGATLSGDVYANRYYDVNFQQRWIEPGGGGQLEGNFEFAASSTGTSYSTAAIELRESNYTGNGTATPPQLGFHWGGVVASNIALESNGRIAIRNNPGNDYEKFGASEIHGRKFFDIDNNQYSFEPAVSAAWRLQTPTGYLDFGSMNASYVHFQTDRDTFYFNKPVAFDGNIFGYGGNETASFARYYDSNDPTFWADPNAESIFRTLKLYNKAAPQNDFVALTIDNGDGTGDIDAPESWVAFNFRDSNANYTPQVRIGGRAGYNTGSADNLDKEGSGNFIVQTSIGSGGAGAGTIRDTFWVDYLGNSTSLTSSRAPIFYDWTNTNWYANPDGDSRLNTITLDGNAVQLREPTGDYGSFMVDGGGRNGWEGFSIGGRVVFMHNNSSAVGMYNDVDNEWLMRFDLNGSNDLYYNGIIQAQTQSGYFLANNEIRSPIFRDTTSPTTWFVDPSGTSRVNTLRTNRIYPAYDNDTSIYIDYVSGDYGSLQINGNGKNGWRGWSLLSHFVWMTPGDAVRHGMYNDVDNQWQQQWYRGAGTRLYYAGGEQFSIENGYALATNQMRAPIYHPPNSTTWRLDLDAGNTSYALRIPGIIRRDNFQTSGDGNNNVLLDTQDYTHWIWRTAGDWGIMWAGNNNPYRSYFSTSNPNEIVFIGNGNLRASIDLDNGDAHFTGNLTAPNIAISGSGGDISLNPAYGSGGADLVLFDFTEYTQAEVTSGLKGAESNNIAQSEYVDVQDAPFAGRVVQTGAYRVFDSDYIPVAPGEDIYGEISVRRVSGSGGLVYMGVRRYDKDKRPIAGNDGITYFVVSSNNYTSTSWTTFRGHTTIPTSHTPYNGSDGGGCRYVRVIVLMNYPSGGGPATRQYGGIMLKRRNVESNLLVDNVVANDILADDITADLIDAYRFRDRDSTGYYIEPANTTESARLRGRMLIGPNNTWGDYIQVGGNGREYINNTGVASVVTTDGNLHIDAASGHQTYINYYDGDNIYFGNGGNGVHSRWQSNGDLFVGGGGSAAAGGFKLDVNGSTQVRGDLYANIFRDRSDPGNRYVDPASTSQINRLNVNEIKSFPSPNYGQLYFDNAGQVYPSGRSQVVGTGLGIYSSYSGGSGSPFTYDITASFNNNGKAFEIAADWINTNRTPLQVRSLRDCCQNWTQWRQIATAGVTYNHGADIYASRYYDSDNDFYYGDFASTSRVAAIDMYSTLSMMNGAQIQLRAPGSNNLRGYIQVRDTNDGHLRIATSGGEDIRFMDGGLDGQWNMIIRGDGNTLINNYIDATRFRDRNSPGFYGDFASTSQMNVVDVNRLRARGSTGYFWDGNEDLSMYVYGEIANSNYAAGNLQPGALNIGHTNRNYAWDGTSWAGSINVGILANTSETWEMAIHDSGDSVKSFVYFNGGSDFQIGRNIGWGTNRVIHPGGTASTIYTDWTNTGYYLNPASLFSSNINGFSLRTRAMLGGPGHSRDIVYSGSAYFHARPTITSDTNYWTGAVGWSRQDFNTRVADWGSGFFDTWSNPPNQPSGTSHWVGVQAYHYSNGSARYGWQLAGGPIAGLRFRNTWSSFSSWKHITMYGVNDAPSGSNGYLYARRFVDTDSSGYYADPASTSRWNSTVSNETYTYGWFRNYTSGRGLYSQANGRHFYSPGNVYWHIDGRSDVGGLIFYDRYNGSQGSSTGRRGYVYYDGSGFGLLHSGGGWALRIFSGNSNHELYGQTYANTLRAYIFYDRNNGSSYYSDPGSTSRLNVSITNTSYFSSNTSRGYAQGYSSRSSSLHRFSYITMNNGSSGWNDYRFHGIASTDYNNNFSDSISINSYNDVNIRLDSNSNNSSSYLRIHDNGRTNALNVAYIGRESNNAIAYFYNRVYGAIYYDHSAGYYFDGNSTTRCNQLTPNRINSPYPGGNSGITRSSSAYSFGFQESGSWSYPYPDLVLQYHTGMSFAANPSYGGMRFFNDYNSSTVRFQINGGSGSTLSHNFSNTWLHVGGGGVGIRSTYNSATFYPNNQSSYGSWNITGSRSGWRGLSFSDSTYRPHLMFDGSSSGGYYIQDLGRWVYYHNRARNCTGFASSSTLSGYRVRINGSLYCNGNVVAYSDRRKKKNIVTIDNALDKVLQLRGVYYERKEDLIDERDDLFKGRQLGMIAQEVLEVVPEVVSYAEEVDEYALDYPKMVGLLVEAHKDQQEIINNQQEKIDKLEEMVYNMMQKMENL